MQRKSIYALAALLAIVVMVTTAALPAGKTIAVIGPHNQPC